MNKHVCQSCYQEHTPCCVDCPCVLAEAWELRKKGIYTMREIAEKIGVNREQLIAAMEAHNDR